MSSSFVKFDIFIFRSCGASGMFDVSKRSLELLKSSSKYFPHSSTNSSLFTGGSPLLLFMFVALFVIDFVKSLMMENTLDYWFRVCASSASTHVCRRELALSFTTDFSTVIAACRHDNSLWSCL